MDSLPHLQQGVLTTSDTAPPISAMDMSLQSKLFRDLCTIFDQGKGTKMLYNVQLAAVHMSFLLKGFKNETGLVRLLSWITLRAHSFYQGLPDLPVDIKAVENRCPLCPQM